MSDSRWTIESQLHYPMINETSLSPDGGRIVYTVREPLMTEEKSQYINHLYIVDVESKERRQLTYGEYNNSSPKWSPCGKYLAFISTRNEKPNIYALRPDGGEAWAVTSCKKSGVGQFQWSLDGDRIYYLMAPPDEDKENKKKLKDDAYLWHEDYTYTHLYYIAFKPGSREKLEPKQLTDGHFQVNGFNPLPDGKKLALTYTESPLVDTFDKTRLGMIRVDPEIPYGLHTIEDVALLATFGGGVKCSPDGKWMACTTQDLPPKRASSSRIVLYPVKRGEPVELHRTHDEQARPIGWTKDSKHVIVSESYRVDSQVYALPVTGEPPVNVAASTTRKKGYSMNDEGMLSYCREDFQTPNTIYMTHPLVDDKEKLVLETEMPEEWHTNHIPEAEVIQWKSKDGTDVEGIVYYPLNYEAGKKYPLILEVHGGPTGVYGRTYTATTSNHGNNPLLTQEGFMILRTNPRGSSGYGKDFRFANYADWGGGDYEDIMSGVDLLIERGMVDPERMGVLGWSYGGYMTSWIITQTDRFKAAVVGAGVTNLHSFNGVTDVPTLIADYFHGDSWEQRDSYMARSAMFHIENAKTPTLIQHGENDVRVPISQGKELYCALKKKGVPTHLVVYPRQGHGVQEPRLQIDLRTRPVEWFKKYVLGVED